MSLIAASSCCCGVECTCPVETATPTSVLLTVTATGCQGTTAVVSCVLLLNANAPCQVGVCLCPKYAFTANLTTPAGCSGNFGCNIPYDTFDYCTSGSPDPGQALLGIAKAALGTNGTGYNADPYTLCDLWLLRLTLEAKGGLSNPSAQSATDVCGDCHWHYPSFPCLNWASVPIEIAFVKPSGQDPRGTYVSGIGGPLEFCAIDPPPCEGCFSGFGMTIDDITVT
jgi:hypothetical protein